MKFGKNGLYLVIKGVHEKHLKLAKVVPVSVWDLAWKDHPFFVVVEPSSQKRLEKKPAIDCFQLRAVSHGRFAKQLGSITAEQMNLVKRALALIQDIDPWHCD